MSKTTSTSGTDLHCASCDARLPAGAPWCSLCFTPTAPALPEPRSAAEPPSTEPPSAEPPSTEPGAETVAEVSAGPPPDAGPAAAADVDGATADAADAAGAGRAAADELAERMLAELANSSTSHRTHVAGVALPGSGAGKALVAGVGMLVLLLLGVGTMALVGSLL